MNVLFGVSLQYSIAASFQFVLMIHSHIKLDIWFIHLFIEKKTTTIVNFLFSKCKILKRFELFIWLFSRFINCGLIFFVSLEYCYQSSVVNNYANKTFWKKKRKLSWKVFSLFFVKSLRCIASAWPLGGVAASGCVGAAGPPQTADCGPCTAKEKQNKNRKSANE